MSCCRSTPDHAQFSAVPQGETDADSVPQDGWRAAGAVVTVLSLTTALLSALSSCLLWAASTNSWCKQSSFVFRATGLRGVPLGLVSFLASCILAALCASELWRHRAVNRVSARAHSVLVALGLLSPVVALCILSTDDTHRTALRFVVHFAPALHLLALAVATSTGILRGQIPLKPRLIAHRGVSRIAPENSLEGIEAASGTGVYGVEFDVAVTRDGVPVLLHDRTFRRTTDIDRVFPGRARDDPSHFTSQELSRLTLSRWCSRQCDGPMDKETERTFNEARVPTMAQALESAQRQRLHAIWDLRKPSNEHAGDWMDIILNLTMASTKVDRSLVWWLADDMSERARSAGFKRACPVTHGHWERAEGRQCDVLNMHHGVSGAELRRAKGMGAWVNAYVVDSEWLFSQMWVLGIDSVTTTNPSTGIIRGPIPNKPRIIAHRGVSRIAPDNSLEGVEAASRVGMYGVEFDVAVTRDGVPVLLHDRTFRRTTDIDSVFPGRAHDDPSHFTSQEVSRLTLSRWCSRQCDGPANREAERTFRKARVPTMAQALESAQRQRLHAIWDLRKPSNEHAGDWMDIILNVTMASTTVDRSLVWWLSDGMSERARSAGFKRACPVKPGHWERAEGRQCDVLNMHHGVSGAELRRAKRSGAWVNVYVVDSEWLFSQMWVLGADSVTSTNPFPMTRMRRPAWTIGLWAYRSVWITLVVVFQLLVVVQVVAESPKGKSTPRQFLVFCGVLWLVSLTAMIIPPLVFIEAGSTGIIRGPIPNKPRIIAHRGVSRIAPDNSLEGVEAASRVGMYGVEFDVAVTQDGVPVLLHDRTFRRTTDIGRVFPGHAHDDPSHFTSQEVLRLTLSRWCSRQCDGPANREAERTFRKARVPTMAQALESALVK
eukprot:m51a1_g12355 hypothetical protein (887) ;mRNA; f:548049-553426